MRLLVIVSLFALINFNAYAMDDEFGARFSSDAPSAFGDFISDTERALADIMPAAGDEDGVVEDDEDDSSDHESETGNEQDDN